MRSLLPTAGEDVDVYDAVRPPEGRWLRVNFIESLDGAVVDAQGRSGGLGGAGDRAVFHALRAQTDVVLVGAGTARTEHYGPHRPTPALVQRRAADGRAAPAAIALVSGKLDLDPAAAVFSAAATPTIVLTSAASPADRRRALAEVARVVVAGDTHVDLAEGLRRLRDDHGLASILCEGGPTLAGGLFSAGLVDELCVTLAPALVSTGGPRLVERLAGCVALRLARVLEQDSELLLSYEVLRAG